MRGVARPLTLHPSLRQAGCLLSILHSACSVCAAPAVQASREGLLAGGLRRKVGRAMGPSFM